MLQSVYILTLGFAAALVGVFVRRLAADHGFAPDFNTGMLVAAAGALAYLCVQLLYMALLRLLKPSRSPLHLWFESFSQCCAVVLLPFLLDWQMTWPHPLLEKIDFLLYAASFLVIHALFKLLSFFSALRMPSSGHVLAAVWLGCGLLAGIGAGAAGLRWQASLIEARAAELAAQESFRIGETYSNGRRIAEGGIFTIPIDEGLEKEMVLRWAIPDDAPKTLESFFLIVQPGGGGATAWQEEVKLVENDWSELRIPAERLAESGGAISLQWNRAAQPAWLLRSGLRPPVEAGYELIMAGPFYPASRDFGDPPSIVVIVLEGLGAEHVHALGCARETSPNLDAFAAHSYNFRNAYTPALTASAASMTLLTGLNPLQHRYLDDRMGPLPEGILTLPEVFRNAGYTTVAFTEGEAAAASDLVFGSGFERGFTYFNPVYPATAAGKVNRPGSQELLPRGASITLDKAASWVESRPGEKFFLFIRLRELHRPFLLQRYGKGFVNDLHNAIPVDVHDTAVRSVDEALGAFLERLRALPDWTDTAMVITSAYGLDFTEPGRGSWRRGGPGVPRLSESSLWVPLFVSVPYELGRDVSLPVALEDVAPTLLALAKLDVPYRMTGQNLLLEEHPNPPVSMAGAPVALSLRQGSWRFTWQSGYDPFDLQQTGEAGVIEFMDIDRYRENTWQHNNLEQHQSTAVKLGEYLWKYLNAYSPGAGSSR